MATIKCLVQIIHIKERRETIEGVKFQWIEKKPFQLFDFSPLSPRQNTIIPYTYCRYATVTLPYQLRSGAERTWQGLKEDTGVSSRYHDEQIGRGWRIREGKAGGIKQLSEFCRFWWLYSLNFTEFSGCTLQIRQNLVVYCGFLYIFARKRTMIKRIIKGSVLADYRRRKVIVLLGARQVGKTTLLSELQEGKEKILSLNCSHTRG